MVVSDDQVRAIGETLKDPNKPLKQRFRALFTLKNLGGKTAIDCICSTFTDSSALLKHELAYCLGQMQEQYAIPYLTQILQDTTQEPMVRHEAGEALGAIGTSDVIELLKHFRKDPVQEVAETCTLALDRICWLDSHQDKRIEQQQGDSPFLTVDPAPAFDGGSVDKLKEILLDEKASLFDRYRAMFTLRNLGTKEAVIAISEGLDCPKSALFRHEIAFVLGQLQDDASVSYLVKKLAEKCESEMVRHECAEALGAIATPECTKVLKEYLHDDKCVVRESCEVALDICEYENSGDFQYADALKDTEGHPGL